MITSEYLNDIILNNSVSYLLNDIILNNNILQLTFFKYRGTGSIKCYGIFPLLNKGIQIITLVCFVIFSSKSHKDHHLEPLSNVFVVDLLHKGSYSSIFKLNENLYWSRLSQYPVC